MLIYLFHESSILILEDNIGKLNANVALSSVSFFFTFRSYYRYASFLGKLEGIA
jgi:hypothetical protein